MKHLCFWVFFLIIILNLPAKANTTGYIDSLQNLIAFYEKENLIGSVLNTRIELIKYVRYSDFELFLELSNSNLELAKKEGLNWAQIDVLMEMGEILISKGIFSEAIVTLNKALELAEIDEYRPYVGWVCISIGNAYEGLFSYQKAIYYYQRASQVLEETNITEGIALSASNIGNCYQELNELDKAEGYLNKGLQFRDSINDFVNWGYIKMYLAEIKINRGYYYEARAELKILEDFISKNIETSIDANQILEAQHLLSTIFWFTSDCEGYLNNKDEAVANLAKGISLSKKMNNFLNLANFYNLIGNIYLGEKEYDQALSFADSALALATNERSFIEEANSYLLYSNIYEESNNPNQAIQYYKKFKSVNDSIFNNSVVQAISDVDVLVQTIENEKNNQILELEVKQKQKTILITLIGGAFILMVISVFVIVIARRFRKEKRLTKELTLKNEEIVQQSSNLEILNEELRKLNISKDKFNSIIAHDLKNPAATVFSLIDLLKGSYDEYPEENKKELIDMAHDMSDRTVKLLENLLVWSRIQDGRMEVKLTNFSISDVVKESLNLSKRMAEAKGVILKSAKMENLEINADKNMITTVIRNLHANAIKFTYTGKQIKSGVNKLDNSIEVWVQDEGIGIPKDKLENIFKIDSEIQRKGTNDEPGTGLGLQLCNEFIKMHNGKISVESEEGQGSRFAFYLPL
ncbi:MAG: tetratricopeptide repeat-containing sensor histidine kinase [Mariniphaga sp.]|nr:tetratricopeptide repeat-containing sensor histidine kinase [Mariniphaga sp.]